MSFNSNAGLDGVPAREKLGFRSYGDVTVNDYAAGFLCTAVRGFRGVSHSVQFWAKGAGALAEGESSPSTVPKGVRTNGCPSR